jgi:chromosome segregation ATPase
MNPPGEWHAATTESATPDTEQLRRELLDAPRELVDWEASCLKNISDLLDSLDKARVRWESLGSDLQESRTRLQRVQEERDLLAESATDADKARSEIQQMRDELEEVRRERDRTAEELVVTKEQLEAHLAEQSDGVASITDELAAVTEQNQALAEKNTALLESLATSKGQDVSLNEQLGILREENEALEQRLVERKSETEEWKHRHESLDTSEQEMRRMMVKRDEELADTKGRLIEADVSIEEEREKRVAAERAAESNEALTKLQQKLDKLDKDHEQNLVMLFDQRTKATRLEDKIEVAEEHERNRVKKIIAKIHKELDAAGAPSGDDLSFGERIRALKNNLA